MSINSRLYRDETDLHTIQSATARWIAAAGFHGYLNIGDIALRLFNGMRRYNPCEIVRLWEDQDECVIGWGMIYPAWNSYEALLHPDYRSGQLAMDILDWAEGEALTWMRKSGQNEHTIQVDVFEGDTPRIALLEQRGYSRGKQRDLVSTRSLDEAIPQPQLPSSFSIRTVQGEQEADKLVALVNNSFGWHWTVEDYSEWMRSPGYPADNE